MEPARIVCPCFGGRPPVVIYDLTECLTLRYLRPRSVEPIMSLVASAGRTIFRKQCSSPLGLMHNATILRTTLSFCSQLQEPKATMQNEPKNDEEDSKQSPNGFQLIYTSNYKRTLHSVKFLSLTGCIGSLIVAPIIIFNPSNIPLLTSIPFVGRWFIGIPVAAFGVASSYALHLFTKCIVTKMYHDPITDNVRLQFVTLFLTTLEMETNLKQMKTLKQDTIGMTNVECTDIGKKCFIEQDHLPEDIADKIGFNADTDSAENDKHDTSWMGKQ